MTYSQMDILRHVRTQATHVSQDRGVSAKANPESKYGRTFMGIPSIYRHILSRHDQNKSIYRYALKGMPLTKIERILKKVSPIKFKAFFLMHTLNQYEGVSFEEYPHSK